MKQAELLGTAVPPPAPDALPMGLPDPGAAAGACAGLARTLNTGAGGLPGVLASVLPEAGLDGGRMQLLLDVTAQQSAMLDPSAASGAVGSVGSHCRVRALGDANTRQQCELVAQLMMGRSPKVAERLAGVGLAERLGLPAGQKPVSRKDVSTALQGISDGLLGATAQPQGCEGLRRINCWLANAARMGEWQAVQQRLGP